MIPYVTRIIAKEIKKLGFKNRCVFYYNKDEILKTDISTNSITLTGNITDQHTNNDNDSTFSAPFWNDVIDWFYHQDIIIRRSFNQFGFEVKNLFENESTIVFASDLEEAILAAGKLLYTQLYT